MFNIRSALSTVICLVIALLLQLTLPPTALAGDTDGTGSRNRLFNIRGFGLYSLKVGESNAEGRVSGAASCSFMTLIGPIAITGDFNSEGKAESKSTIGLAASVELLLLNERLGIEIGGLLINDLIEYELKSEFTNTTPPTNVPEVVEAGAEDAYMAALALNFHITPQKTIDLYAGPLFAPAVKIAGSDAIDVGGDVAYGFNIGADYLTDGPFMLSAKLSYVDFGQVEIKEGWGLSEKGSIGGVFDCGGAVYSRFEAEDDLRFMAVMIGGGFRF